MLQKSFRTSVFLVLVNIFNCGYVYAETIKNVLVVNFMTDNGLLYSYTHLSKGDNFTYSMPYNNTPTIIKMKPREWGLNDVVVTHIQENISNIKGFNIIQLNNDLYNQYDIVNLTQVVKDGDLSQEIIETLAILGRVQHVDYVYAVFLTRGDYTSPNNANWIATPPAAAIIYENVKIFAGVATWHFVIDVKNEKIVGEHRLQNFREINLPPRVLTKPEVNRIKKWVNEDIVGKSNYLTDKDVDFSKPLTDSDIEKIYSKVVEENHENIQLLDMLLFPLHHKMSEFEQQPESVINIIRKTLQQAAVEPIHNEIENVMYNIVEPEDSF